MERRTTNQLDDLMNSILATEDPALVAGAQDAPQERLLDQMEGLGKLERLVRVALQECAVELRHEGTTWAQISETFGSSLQSAYGRWHEAAARDAAGQIYEVQPK